jgi:hypothetical protein
MNFPKVSRRTVVAAAMVSTLLIAAGPTALANPLSAASVVHSTDFAGYNATITTPVTTVTGTLTVPTVTCPAAGLNEMSSGINLDGTGSMFAEVFILCYDGALEQNPLLEVGINSSAGPTEGGIGDIAVSSGDRLSFSLSDDTAAKSLAGLVKDKTNGFSASAKGPGSIEPMAGTPLSVQAGTSVVGNGTGPTTVPSFTPGFTIGALKFGSSTLSTFSPMESEMYNGTTLQIATGKISTAGSFITTFKHS